MRPTREQVQAIIERAIAFGAENIRAGRPPDHGWWLVRERVLRDILREPETR